MFVFINLKKFISPFLPPETFRLILSIGAKGEMDSRNGYYKIKLGTFVPQMNHKGSEKVKRISLIGKGLFCFLLGLAIAGTTGFSSLPSAAEDQPATSEQCPKAEDLIQPDENAEKEIRDVLPQLIQETYGDDSRYQNYEVKRILTLKAPESSPYSGIAEQQCGKEVAGKSLLVELFFPEFLPSASLSQGQVFMVKTNEGWKVWYRYH